MKIKQEFIISDEKAARIGVLIVIPSVIIINIFFLFIWRENLHIIKDYYLESKLVNNALMKIFKMALPFLIFLLGMLVHELLHFIPLAIFSKKGIKAVKFGVNKKSFVLFTKSEDPIKAWQYMLATILPVTILGFFPLIISFIYGFPWLWMFAFTSIVAGTGDFITLIFLVKVGRNELVLDSPKNIGFNIIE